MMAEGHEFESPRFVRAPLIGLALLAVLGTWAGLNGSPFLALLGLPLLVVALWRKSLVPLAWGAWFVAFVLRAWVAEHPASPAELGQQMERDSEALEIIGVVAAEPVLFTRTDGSRTNLFVPLRLEAVNRDLAWRRAVGDVQLAAFGWVPELTYGDRVLVVGDVQQREGPGALLGRTAYRMHARRVETLASDQGSPILAPCYRLRQWAARTLSAGLTSSPDEAAVVRAMILGYRQDLPEVWQTWFARTGTLHVFAISGLHIGILAGLLVVFLRMAGVSRLHYVYLIAPLLLLFVITTGLKASAIRACIMAVLYWLGPALRREPNSRTALALSVIVLLAWAPHQLESIGFLFSVSIVTGILILYPVLHRPLNKLGMPDPWQLTEETIGYKFRTAFLGWLSGLLAISGAAWLVSAPLTALFFNNFSPGALIGNLAVVPLAGLIVWTSVISLASGAIWLPLAAACNQVNALLVGILVKVTEGLHALPHSWQFVQSPPLAGLVLYYLALAVVVWRRATGRLVWLGLLAVIVGFVARGWFAQQEPRADLLALREGQTIVLSAPGYTCLVDSGSAFQFSRVAWHLRGLGVDRIDTLVLTHADSDHVSGVPDLLAAWPVGEALIPDTPRRSPSLDRALAALDEAGVPVRRVGRGEDGWFGKALYWQALHPEPGLSVARADEHSLILKVSAPGGRSLLLSGGAGSEAEAGLLAAGVEPAATFACLGNTADHDVGSEAWLQALAADLVIVPPLTWLREGNPNRALAERLDAVGVDWLRLDQERSLRLFLERGRVVQLEPDRR